MAQNLARRTRARFHFWEAIRNFFYSVKAIAVWRISPEIDIRVLWLARRGGWGWYSPLGWLLPSEAILVCRLRGGGSQPFLRAASRDPSVGRTLSARVSPAELVSFLTDGDSRLGAKTIREVAKRFGGDINQLSTVFLSGWSEKPSRKS